MNNENKECCPKFNLDKWDNRTLEWDQKKFIKTSVPTFFHIPFPPLIGKKITQMMEIAEKEDKLEENEEETLLLFTDPNAFKSELYLSVTGDIHNANNTTISGTFVSKVFDGTYNALPKFMKQMSYELSQQNKKVKKYYVHYAYCPKCAKDFGHNYMVLFAEI